MKLLSAVRCLHSNGLVLRNLRPETIFFETETSFNEIKILDLASMVETAPANTLATTEQEELYELLTKSSSILFKAPELIYAHHRRFHMSSDLWTVGVLLYNMLTGIPPFFESNENTTRVQIKSGVFSIEYPNYTNNISKAAKDLVARLLVTDSDNRITASEAIFHPWLQSSVPFPLVTRKVANDALQNFKNLLFSQQLQRSVLMYMAKTMLGKKERDEITALFETIDDNRDA